MMIKFQKFLLILIRITSFIFQVPIFSLRGLSNIFKLSLSLSFSLIAYINTPDIQIDVNIVIFSLLIFKEILLGLLLGLIASLIFTTIEIAGQLIDIQLGLSIGNIFDFNLGRQAAYYERLYYWLGVTIFFILDLHIVIIKSIIQSFIFIPVTKIDFSSINILGFINILMKIFEISINLAAPMVILILIIDFILGIISKVIPQINLLILGMPIKSLAGYMLIFAMLPWLINNFADILIKLTYDINRFITIFIK